jgi:hypothetical protein
MALARYGETPGLRVWGRYVEPEHKLPFASVLQDARPYYLFLYRCSWNSHGPPPFKP